MTFALSLEKSVDMSTLCMIEYRPGDPQCNKIPNGHLIFLSSKAMNGGDGHINLT